MIVAPCNKGGEYLEPRNRERRTDQPRPQCAGVAIFRANTDRAKFMPLSLDTHAPDHATVFSTEAQFLAHHNQTSVAEAERWLAEVTLVNIMSAEMARLSHIYNDQLNAEKSANTA